LTDSRSATNPRNPHSATPALRALFAALEEWVTKGTAPPPSRVPRIVDGHRCHGREHQDAGGAGLRRRTRRQPIATKVIARRSPASNDRVTRAALDPAAPQNRIVVDFDKIRGKARGLVEYETDFFILRPTDPSRTKGALVDDQSRLEADFPSPRRRAG
jgi:hypothetical protein